MASGSATANRFFARRGRNGAADRTLTLHTTSHTFIKRSVIEQTKTSDFPLSLLRITLVPFVASQMKSVSLFRGAEILSGLPTFSVTREAHLQDLFCLVGSQASK